MTVLTKKLSLVILVVLQGCDQVQSRLTGERAIELTPALPPALQNQSVPGAAAVIPKQAESVPQPVAPKDYIRVYSTGEEEVIFRGTRQFKSESAGGDSKLSDGSGGTAASSPESGSVGTRLGVSISTTDGVLKPSVVLKGQDSVIELRSDRTDSPVQTLK